MKKRRNLQNKVYSFLLKIPKGKISTYKQIAKAIGHPKSFRVIGNILSKNKDTNNISCYKIVKSDGNVGGYNLGIKKKKELLKRDGIEIKNNKIVNLDRYLFKR